MTRFAASPRTLPSDTPSGSSSPLDDVKDLRRLKALLTDGFDVEDASALGFCGTGLGVAFLLVLGSGFGFGGVGGTGFSLVGFGCGFAVAPVAALPQRAIVLGAYPSDELGGDNVIGFRLRVSIGYDKEEHNGPQVQHNTGT